MASQSFSSGSNGAESANRSSIRSSSSLSMGGKSWEQVLYTTNSTYSENPTWNDNVIPNKRCFCGAQVSMSTAMTNLHPGRRFIHCPYFPNGGCRYFEWYDDAICRRATELIPIMRDEIRSLWAEVNALEANRQQHSLKQEIESQKAYVATLENKYAEGCMELQILRERLRSSRSKEDCGFYKCVSFCEGLWILIGLGLSFVFLCLFKYKFDK